MSAFYRWLVVYLVVLFASLACAHLAASRIEARLMRARLAPAQPAEQQQSKDAPAPRAKGARKGWSDDMDVMEHEAGVGRRPTPRGLV